MEQGVCQAPLVCKVGCVCGKGCDSRCCIIGWSRSQQTWGSVSSMLSSALLLQGGQACPLDAIITRPHQSPS